MRTLLSKILLPLCLVISSFSAMAADIDSKNPYTMIQQVADQTFARFNADQSKIKADPNHLKTIISDELLPYVDYKYAAYTVLGRNLRQLSKAQRNDFSIAFKDYLVSTYATAFTEYTDQKIKFAPAKDFSNQKIVTVPVQVVSNGRPPINISFKVRKLKNGTWKAFDLVAEGVSLLQSKQSEIGGLIQRQGIDSVIKMLNEKAKAPIQAKTEKK
ncbi:ABC transporter substrate-binding protein [Parashewanella curva]|uniref:ABC transporter substrate-binding protein n=1 Tax=Parashewanella curva TaxID=2338552 RepID=A0A3L8Q1S4_9GAMM|nr:ABC transporter substrate-binding protein [Parashewanella curva]RLV60262.1 ABC transporter substrate-binding protein [Parashewanella curva]